MGRASVRKQAVFQAQLAESRVVLEDIGAVERIVAELCNTREFPFEKPALHIVGGVVFTGLGRLNDEIINLG